MHQKIKRALSITFFLPAVCFAVAPGISSSQNKQGNWDIYYTSPNNKKFFIDENEQLTAPSIQNGDITYGIEGNIVWILYVCWNEQNTGLCSRYIDLKTNQLSRIIPSPAVMISDMQSHTLKPIQNLKQNVIVLFQYPTANQYVITPIFTACKNPFNYQLGYLSDGLDVGSHFLADGRLYLNIVKDQDSKNQQVTIPINYPELFKNCQGNA